MTTKHTSPMLDDNSLRMLDDNSLRAGIAASICTMISVAFEHALNDRDERVRRTLRSKIAECRETARELRREAAELEHAAWEIEEAVLTERWYDVARLLSATDVESLCECSPAGLLNVEEA